MATIKTFPQVIFVTVIEDGGDDYMLAALTKGDALNDEDRAIIGMYQFVAAEEVKSQWSAKRIRNRRTR